MLTSMKLTGEIDKLAKYHTGEDNYYFKQASNIENILEDKGFNIQGQESLEYVKVYGKICKNLDLSQGMPISEATLANLLEGKNIHGEQITKKHKVHGIDLTFSAPKTVSIAGLVVEKSPKIIEAHDQAVLETMKEIEKFCSYSRVRNGEIVESKETEGLLYATVRDGLNRENEPHLHTHVLLMNLTKYKGKFVAVDGKKIMFKDFNLMWGNVYRTHLASNLKELDYNISYTKKGFWRLDNISQNIEDKFSKRRKKILEMKAKGELDIDAWRKTRKGKSNKISKEDIVSGWQNIINKDKSSEIENREETIEARKKWLEEAVWSVEAKQEIGERKNRSEIEKWQYAIRRATNKEAIVSEYSLITEYINENLREESWKNTVTYEKAKRLLKKQVSMNNILNKDGFYTSWEMLKAERRYMDIAGVELQDWDILQKERVEKLIKKYIKNVERDGEKPLSEIQATAVKKILSSKMAVNVVQGDAGSGKTTMFRAVRDLILDKDIEIKGIAMQGVAARNLEKEAGIKSTTLASYLDEDRKQTKRKRLIVLDEASMLDSRNAAKLFDKVRKNDDKIVLIGDVNQLNPLSAGNVFERFVEDAERAGDLILLNENFRQKDKNLREAVMLARKGNMKESLNILFDENHVFEEIDQYERQKKVANMYNKDTLIITATGKAKGDIDLLVREALIENNKLDDTKSFIYEKSYADEDGIEYKKYIKFTKGDKISFNRNDYKNYNLRNGERGEILELDENFIKVKLEDKRAIAIDVEKYNYFDYGYAMTTYKAQGQTFDKVVVDSDTKISSLSDMRNQYVNITRARENVSIFTDDYERLKELAVFSSRAKDTLGFGYYSLEDIEKSEKAVEQLAIKELDKNNKKHNKGRFLEY